MKLKHPEMMTPGYWLTTTSGLRVEGTHASMTSVGREFKFKTSMNKNRQVVIENHGSMRVTRSGDRDTDWRADMRRLCGVGCDLAKEFSGQLFCPHTAKKISVSRIEGNPSLWIDYEARTACNPYDVVYVSPDAPPTLPASQIKYSFDNPKATKAFMARLMPILREAKLRCAMMELKPEYHRGGMIALIRLIHKGTTIVSIESGKLELSIKLLAWGLDRVACDKDFIDEIKLLCADHYSSNYLEYRE